MPVTFGRMPLPLPTVRSPLPTSQKTLRNPIGCVGTGLHSGAKVALTLHPAGPDTGIRFRRYDRAGVAPIPARFEWVRDTTLCTHLGEPERPSVATVEHLLAALAACEIDNALIEVGGPEVPIMDGSAQPFVFLIECAGTVEQDRPRRYIEVLKPVAVTARGKSARLEPDDGFSLDAEISFDHALIRKQRLQLDFSPDAFKLEVARARTFGFAEDLEDLWSRGLALGGSLKNAVVVSRERVLNEEGLRFADEFVRHKLLDAVGDLSLAGAPMIGRYVGRCAGHALHNKLLRALFADRSAWRYVEGRSSAEAWEPVPAVGAPAARAAVPA